MAEARVYKFWDSFDSASVSVFLIRVADSVVELKICGKYEDKNGVVARERCMTVCLSIDDLKHIKQLIEQVIK